MTEIYNEISKLTDEFRKIGYAYSNDTNKIREAVQELMVYFLQMNPVTLKNIYIKDGIEGITKYGAVALRRALTSKRSNFYYKFQKYYTHIDTYSSTATYESDYYTEKKNLYNLPNEPVDNFQWTKLEEIDVELDKLHWYDRELFKLYYYEGNTLDEVAEKTRISRNSIFTTIDKIRRILKKALSE
jgi:hypothetical protein